MKPSSPLALALVVAALIVGVLGSVALWPANGADTGREAQGEPTADRVAIFTATPAPTPKPTPVPTGVVVEVVSLCTMRHFGGPRLLTQAESDLVSASVCTPPYPLGLTHVSRHLKVTIRGDAGGLFEEFLPGSSSIAVGSLWPPK